MPAINSLTTTTSPNVASPSGNVIINSPPINSINNSTSALLKAEPDNKFAQEMAYSAHIRHERSNNNDMCHMKDIACRKLNPLELPEEYVNRKLVCTYLKGINCTPKKP